MIVIDKVVSLQTVMSESDREFGFVPTMGALHQGHLSLISESVKNNPGTVVSIFVNPTQFNDPSDLEKYPRNLEADLNLLKDILSDNDIVFTPSYKDLYSREKSYSLDLNGIDKVMEGLHRPGHFEGVVRVVKLLLEAVRPARAYFGQKDFQQLSIIRMMVKKLNMNIEIVACPIIREENGLAMSSRNERLSPELRKEAGAIYTNLKKHSKVYNASDLKLIKSKITESINSLPEFSVEYFELVDNVNLSGINNPSDINPELLYFGCIAVNVGDIRLIDNTEFSFLFIKG